jgi:hypothetical protein
VLLARRRRKYRPPDTPDPLLRRAAMRGAQRGVDKMAAELAHLRPSEQDYQQALDELAAATQEVAALEREARATRIAVDRWTQENMWRLDLGESVSWAGEQDGFAAAADTDGQLLEWLTEPDRNVCGDCRALSTLPPMPRADWPTTPGSGATQCSGGCRCTLEAVADLAPGDQLYALNEDDHAVIGRVAGQALSVLT